MRTITILFVLWTLFYGTKSANLCTKQRCDFLKALLPFLIILHHHAQRTDWPWPFDGDFSSALGACVVMMFFFISGYGLECKRSSKGLSIKELPTRLKKLFTPTLLPIAMYVGMLFLTDANISGCLKSCLAGGWYPLPHSWFIVVLAILYVGFYVCARLAKNGTKFLVLLFAYSALTIIALKLLHAPGYMIGSDLAVFVGAAYKQYEDRILDILKICWLKPFVAIFAIVLALTYMHFRGDMPKLLKLSRYLWLVLIFAMFAYVKVFKSKATDFLTRISYDVYLCQGIAFGIVPYKEMDFALPFLVVCLLTVVLATFSHWTHGKVFHQ